MKHSITQLHDLLLAPFGSFKEEMTTSSTKKKGNDKGSYRLRVQVTVGSANGLNSGRTVRTLSPQQQKEESGWT
jgi:hypothetical protein